MLSYEVYKITNKVNGKVYIGITNRGAGARFKQHLFEAEHGSSFRFHNALRKYGADGFDINIISFCKNAEELKEREKFFIKEYDSTNPEKGYNMTEGGDGTFGKIITLLGSESTRMPGTWAGVIEVEPMITCAVAFS